MDPGGLMWSGAAICMARLLVLGGTWFLGRAVVDEGLRAGHDVTVFNRGRSAGSPADARVVHGDRTVRSDLDRLAQMGPWDAVVDVPGVIPAQVRDAARALQRDLAFGGNQLPTMRQGDLQP